MRPGSKTSGVPKQFKMADEQQQVQIKLQELFLASRKLRFLHLKSKEELIFNAKLCGEHMPLFLGADVLANCSISVSNLPRTHAKFFKKGLATRVNFPSHVRINGIQGTGKGVWFYSIQGLFRVAFGMYPREEQLDLLKCLQGVWTLRFGDQLLSEVVNLLPFDICENRREEMNVEKEESDGTDVPVSVENCTPCSTKQNTPNVSLEIRNTNLAEQNKYKSIENVEKEQTPHWKYRDILPELTDLTRTCDIGNSSSEFDIIVTTLRALLQSYKTLEHSTELSSMDHQQKILYTISYWVGNKFRKYKEEISQKVTEFKKRHIATIDSLPPAEKVIVELFPQAMIVLLKTWMEDESQKPQGDPQTFLPFPLIQLILEFANQTLVSGVSHVLYSRLIRSDSV